MENITADKIIKILGLSPLATEGGYFKQTYCDEFGTAIYYLVTPDSWSSLHKLRFPEIYHFYCGDPLVQLQLFPDGSAKRIEFSADLSRGHQPQLLCAADVFQATRLVQGGRWALVGTTMAPGYTEDCIEFAGAGDLIPRYPEHESLIKEFS